MTIFTKDELAYLESQFLGRLATVDAAGAPQNNPVGFVVRDDGTVDIGGHAMGRTRKFRNVERGGHAALVVDDLVSTSPWTVRGVEIRGTAEALTDVDPPMRGMSREVIRITPTWIASWGLVEGAPMRIEGRRA
jgi:pyridoxamine 5'-phosphate oxidase family protein